MVQNDKSAGDGSLSDSTEQTGIEAAQQRLPQRAGKILLRDLIGLYMQAYEGRDGTRAQRLAWWSQRVGAVELQELSDDDVHAALEELQHARSKYFAGNDVDGKPIFKDKRKALAPATVNRYAAALAAVISWSIRRRVAPKGYINPCRSVERRVENNARVRFLSDAERQALLEACKASSWPRLYCLTLLALTTGARKAELTSLHWADIDLERGLATLARSKNGDQRVLPLTAAAIAELKRFVGADNALVFGSSRLPGQPFAFEGLFAKAMHDAKVRNFCFHSLRHSCASMLARSGASLLEIGDVLGHRTASMTKRYSHLCVAHKSELIERVMLSVA